MVTPLNLPEVLEAYLLASNTPRKKEGRIWASDLGIALGPELDGCTLSFWLKCKDEPRRDKTAGELLMLSIGNTTHDFIADLISKAVQPYGWTVESVEKRVTLEVEIDGDTTESVGSRLDIKLKHGETGATHVIDIKTKRGGAFRFLLDGKPGDYLQVQAYMKGEDADFGSLLYVDREGQNFVREFNVPRSDHRPEEAIKRLVAIRDNPTPPDPVELRLERKENKGPDSVYIKMPWQIEWCDLLTCACKKSLPCKTVPSGIVAKLHPVKGAEKSYTVKVTEDGEPVRSMLLAMLEKKYPDETFHMEDPA